MSRNTPFHLSEELLASWVGEASGRVILALPGLPMAVGEAFLAARERLGDRALVIVDPDERVYRLGLGSFEAIKLIHGSGAPILRAEGLRMGCCLIDDRAFFLTLPPLLVEAPPEQGVEPINAVGTDPQGAISYLRKLANSEELSLALEMAPGLSDDFQEDILDRIKAEQELEDGQPKALPMIPEEIESVEKSLTLAAPENFQVHRQSMVYQALLLFVEIEVTGCQLKRRTLSVGKALLPLLGEAADLLTEHSFEIAPPGNTPAMEAIQHRVKVLRTEIARNLGKPYGTILLRRDLDMFKAEALLIQSLIEKDQPQALEAFMRGVGPKLNQVVEVCTRQFLAAVSKKSLWNRLFPELLIQFRPEYPENFDAEYNMEEWEVTQEKLRLKIREALERNLKRMLKSLSNPKLEITIRQFTLQQMNEKEFQYRLRRNFRDDKSVVAYVESKAILGTPI